MTTENNFFGRNRDQQDGIERHIWDEIEYISDAGAVLKVTGTGTVDEEAILLNQGYGMNLEKGTDAEVLLFAGASDTNQKFAMPQIPHAKQRQWKQKTGGIQDPMDGDRALEFNPDMAHLLATVVALHKDGILEVKDGEVIIRGNLNISGELQVGGKAEVGGVVNAAAHPVPGNPDPVQNFQPFTG